MFHVILALYFGNKEFLQLQVFNDKLSSLLPLRNAVRCTAFINVVYATVFRFSCIPPLLFPLFLSLSVLFLDSSSCLSCLSFFYLFLFMYYKMVQFLYCILY